MFSERTFDTGCLRINYAESAPNGAPLLVLHGISDRWQGMVGLLAPLSKRWHVFACDQRGHGKSGRATSYRAIDYFPDIAALVKHRIGAPTVLIGHSGGALSALGIASQIPELVRALVVLEPPLCLRELSISDNDMDRFMSGIYAILTQRRTVRQVMAEFFPNLDKARIAWFSETLACVDPELVKAVLEDRYFQGLDLGRLLGQVKCPALMLYGDLEQGSFVRDVDCEFFLANTPKAEAKQIEGASHFLHAEQPAKILELVTQWLQRFREFD